MIEGIRKNVPNAMRISKNKVKFKALKALVTNIKTNLLEALKERLYVNTCGQAVAAIQVPLRKADNFMGIACGTVDSKLLDQARFDRLWVSFFPDLEQADRQLVVTLIA